MVSTQIGLREGGLDTVIIWVVLNASLTHHHEVKTCLDLARVTSLLTEFHYLKHQV